MLITLHLSSNVIYQNSISHWRVPKSNNFADIRIKYLPSRPHVTPLNIILTFHWRVPSKNQMLFKLTNP